MIDEGRAATLEEARAIVRGYRIGVLVAEGFQRSRAATAALLTTLATAVRAFPGGVSLVADGDPILIHGWGRGRRLSEIVAVMSPSAGHGLVEQVVEIPDGVKSIVCIGVDGPSGRRWIRATWAGWSGGVVTAPGQARDEDDGQPLSAVLAAAIAVSESFQGMRGFALAGRREVGISLWRPDLAWNGPEALGPKLEWLPERLWLLGLGHLGQAYAWCLGWLPYPSLTQLTVGLVDPQRVVPANVDTGLLTTIHDAGNSKARVVANALEELGVATIVVERLFTANFNTQRGEPMLAIAGFDDPLPRRDLESAGFVHSIDAGLGVGPEYLDGVVHAFPATTSAAAAFPALDRDGDSARLQKLLQEPAYLHALDEARKADPMTDPGRCGLEQVAGITVGVAFVGVVAATLAIAEELRTLGGGPRFEVVGFSLRDPSSTQAIINVRPGRPQNPGFVPAE